MMQRTWLGSRYDLNWRPSFICRDRSMMSSSYYVIIMMCAGFDWEMRSCGALRAAAAAAAAAGKRGRNGVARDSPSPPALVVFPTVEAVGVGNERSCLQLVFWLN